MCWILLVRKSDTHSIPHDSMSHLRGEFLLSLYNCTLSGWDICMYYLLAGASDHLPLHVISENVNGVTPLPEMRNLILGLGCHSPLTSSEPPSRMHRMFLLSGSFQL